MCPFAVGSGHPPTPPLTLARNDSGTSPRLLSNKFQTLDPELSAGSSLLGNESQQALHYLKIYRAKPNKQERLIQLHETNNKHREIIPGRSVKLDELLGIKKVRIPETI